MFSLKVPDRWLVPIFTVGAIVLILLMLWLEAETNRFNRINDRDRPSQRR